MDRLCSTAHRCNRCARAIDVSSCSGAEAQERTMAELALTREHWNLLIEGGSPPANRACVIAPYDGAEIATVDIAGPRHADEAIAAAYALYRDRDGWLPLHRRVAILDRLAALMTEHQDELALEAAREGGKPLTDSKVEMARAIDGVRLCTEHIRGDAGDVIPMGTTAAAAGRIAFTQKEPIGVVVAISAFNHPLNLIVHQVLAAVAAGCPVIVKPASTTPLSCLRLVQLLHDAGLPKGWCQAVVAGRAVAEKLVTDPRVAFMSFIGSGEVGWSLRSKLAPGTRCALEHGGIAPVIIGPNADIELSLNAVLKGGFYHAGQVCVSVKRVYVPRAQARDWAQALADRASKLRIGDPTDAKTEVGPLIQHSETVRVHGWVTAAVSAGAQRLCGGDPLGPSTYPCTVLLDPPLDADVSRKEVFGPVVCVYGYDDLKDAFAAANSLPYAFQAAIFTRDLDAALRAFRHLDASAVMINDHTAFRVDGMPFAGLRESGLGIGGIPHTIDDMRIDKMMVIKSAVL
jgi:acyl-CoA reductase-like NAD-dependent aldehyde dehydrogenase